MPGLGSTRAPWPPGQSGTFTAKAVNRGNLIVAGGGAGATLMVTVEEMITVSTLYSASLLVPAAGCFSGRTGWRGAHDTPPSELVCIRADVIEHSLCSDRTRVLEGTVPLLEGTVVSCAAADVAVVCRLLPFPGMGEGVVAVAYSYMVKVQVRGEGGKVRVFLLPGPEVREQFTVPLRMACTCQAELEVRCLRAVLGPAPP